MVSLTGHEAGNGGYTQGDSYSDAHTSPTRRDIQRRVCKSCFTYSHPGRGESKIVRSGFTKDYDL
jgi:hypothetical protein